MTQRHPLLHDHITQPHSYNHLHLSSHHLKHHPDVAKDTHNLTPPTTTPKKCTHSPQNESHILSHHPTYNPNDFKDTHYITRHIPKPDSTTHSLNYCHLIHNADTANGTQSTTSLCATTSPTTTHNLQLHSMPPRSNHDPDKANRKITVSKVSLLGNYICPHDT